MRSFRVMSIGTLAAVLAGLVLLPASAGARPQASPGLEEHDNIRILSDQQFTFANGVRSGSGTPADPYVISGWMVHELEIKDTTKVVTIADNVVTGTLRLNYIGSRITVTGNKIRDLRVNENIRRKGEITSGIISGNSIDRVGQIRHWDGVFEDNRVGTSNMSARAINADGFNGAIFRNNVVYGYFDARLHGHHHSSGFDESAHSHHHGDPSTQGGAEGMLEDHSKRYHRVLIEGNEIHSTSTWALRYYDQAHSANDRTNASETNEELNKPHVHTTKVELSDNRLYGAGLWIDIFNADDRNHLGTTTGAVEIAGNSIDMSREGTRYFGQPYGIVVRQARDAEVHISGNSVVGPAPPSGPLAPVDDLLDGEPTGINLMDLDLANIYIYDNYLEEFVVGVNASRFTESVHWYIDGLRTNNVRTKVRYNPNNVPNAPQKRPSP